MPGNTQMYLMGAAALAAEVNPAAGSASVAQLVNTNGGSNHGFWRSAVTAPARNLLPSSSTIASGES